MKTLKPKTKRDSGVEHKCALYPYSTRILWSYQQHSRVHSNKRPFKCPESGCPYRAKWELCIKQHVENIHRPQSRRFPCPHPGCSYAAKRKSKLTQHSLIHSDEKSLFCSHPNCNYSTNAKTKLIIHTRIHTGEKPYGCQFESCSFAAAQSGGLILHMRTHTKERPFKCPEPNCEYAVARKSHLEQHQLNHHDPKEGEERPSFQCPLCEYKGKSKKNLLAHIKCHTLEKVFKCDEPNSNCNYEGKSKAAIKSHKLVHSAEKSFACTFESCEYQCKRQQTLSTHLKSHSEERLYKCGLCAYRGKTRSFVTSHLKNVHSDLRPFQCQQPQCNYAAKIKKRLNQHRLTHTNEKKYSCSFLACEYKAVSASMVKSHQISHETDKKFKCGLCPFACKMEKTLVDHTRTHTKEEPYICREKSSGCEYRGKTWRTVRRHEKNEHPELIQQKN